MTYFNEICRQWDTNLEYRPNFIPQLAINKIRDRKPTPHLYCLKNPDVDQKNSKRV